MFTMVAGSSFSFMHSLLIKISFSFMFLFDNRGYWWWSCLSFAKVQCGIKELDLQFILYHWFFICLNEKSRSLLTIAVDEGG
ncbi:hypothetical protein NC653_027781 [Populus alba x Populus x berolinensis]|uniref:Uncharacterized protein n=1 Tax=Populus alba x Populus x berolinensis TaxID=444605 RepID=A0AAD6M8P2_9ROSI|nr:hypothetical protein NC653_027781 [Populus alba x Populus x berolinensis]